MKKKIMKRAAIVLAAMLLLGGLFAGFRLLVKVGSVKYIYNYMHDTAGGRQAVNYPEAMTGADASAPYSLPDTAPEYFGIEETLEVDGKRVTGYSRTESIDFSDEVGLLDEAAGLFTFRGDYIRNRSTAGGTTLAQGKFSQEYWTYNTGKVLKSNGVDYWSGNGWTGQPVIVRWDEETKQLMNLYEDARSKADLVEVIYPGMDGWIHFLDMETGEETRPAINVGMTFKGSASLYPDGTPMLFCGSGDAQTGMYGENISPRFYIYSLIDGSRLYEYGYDEEMAPRIWHAYDSSPVIHAETDTLIYPGENGVVYTMKLNTDYDRENGSLSIAPSEIVKYSFTSEAYGEDKYLWGSECSASVWKNYLYLGDNGGTLYCLDLNSMSMVWAQSLSEDINSSPVFEEDEDGNKFLYAATTLKYGYDSHSMGDAAIYKVNAMTGAVIWKKAYEVHTVKGLAGGVLSTGVVGKGVLEDYVIYSVSKVPAVDSGYIVALSKENGEEAWRKELSTYSWSSTAVFYDGDRAYMVQGCQNGDLLLLDAATGEELSKLNFGSAIEATPVVYGNNVVFGTRSEKIYGITLK